MCKEEDRSALFAKSKTIQTTTITTTARRRKAGYGAHRLPERQAGHSQHAVSWRMVFNMVVT